MVLQAVVDNLDDMSDAIKAEYKAGEGDYEGKFVVDVTAVSGLSLGTSEKSHNALLAERGITKDLNSKLKAFELDGNPITAQAAIDAINKVKSFDPADKEAMKQTIIDEVHSGYADKQKELESKSSALIAKSEEDNGKLRSQLHKHLVSSVAIKALSAKAPDAVELLLPHVLGKIKVVDEEDGTQSIIVMNKDGGTALSPVAHNNSPMTIEEMVDEMSKDDRYSNCFAGSGSKGSGSKGKSGGKTSTTGLEGLTAGDKLKAIRAQEAAGQ